VPVIQADLRPPISPELSPINFASLASTSTIGLQLSGLHVRRHIEAVHHYCLAGTVSCLFTEALLNGVLALNAR